MCSVCVCLADAPENGEKFEKIIQDIEQHILPGLVLWNHPKFFAYYPSAAVFPSILGDMLSTAFNQIGFSWVIEDEFFYFFPFCLFIAVNQQLWSV